MPEMESKSGTRKNDGYES